jgi:hypothetical protein
MEGNEDNENAGTSVLRHFLYWIYERRLLVQIQKRSMPHHIGIILDGNRRHARQRGLSDPCEIYRRGAEKLDDILDWCADLSVPAVTLWVFSTENRKRSPAEISGILAAIEAKITALAHKPSTHRKRIRVKAIGRLDLLPESVVAAIRAAETATASYNSMTLTIAVAYAGVRRSPTLSATCSGSKRRKEPPCPRSSSASHPRASLAISMRRTYLIPTSSYGQVARFACPASSSGRAFTANFTSQMFYGLPSAKSTSCAQSALIRTATAASVNNGSMAAAGGLFWPGPDGQDGMLPTWSRLRPDLGLCSAAQGCDRQAAEAKACRKACAPQD